MIRNLLSLMFAAIAVAAPATTATAESWIDVSVMANRDRPEILEHIALLGRYDDGRQFVVARTICKECFGVEPGTPIGEEYVADGVGIWGTGGVAVDIEISNVPLPGRDLTGPLGLRTPPRLMILLDNGDIAELQGIWGTGGVAVPDITTWLPGPGDWAPKASGARLSRTGLDYGGEACGRAATLAETTVQLLAIDADGRSAFNGQYPAFAVGTEKGCVGLASFEIDLAKGITSSFENPIISFENPIISFENPIISFENPIISFDGMAPVFREESGDRREGFGLALSLDGKLAGIDTGSWVYEASTATVKASSATTFRTTFTELDLPDGSTARGIATPPINYTEDFEPASPSDPEATPIVTSNGTASIRVGVMPGDNETIFFDLKQVVTMSREVRRVALGSLAALSTDEQSVLFAPVFDPVTAGGDAVLELDLGGIESVGFGPNTVSLKSKGQTVTAVIEAAGGDVEKIVASSVRLNVGGLDPTPQLLPRVTHVTDNDGDGNLELVCKFSRSELQALLSLPDGGEAYGGLLLSWSNNAESCANGSCQGAYPFVVRIIE